MDYKNITKDEIELALSQYFKEKVKKYFEKVKLKHYVWEENGKKYSAWKIGNLMTGDGGMEIYLEELEKQFKNAS